MNTLLNPLDPPVVFFVVYQQWPQYCSLFNGCCLTPGVYVNRLPDSLLQNLQNCSKAGPAYPVHNRKYSDDVSESLAFTPLCILIK